MSNWYIYDNQITETPGLDISWLPAAAYRYVTPHLRRVALRPNDVSLEAGPYIGALPLKNGDTLYIIPRVGRESYSRMIFVVEGLEDAVSKEFEEFVQIGFEESSNTPWGILLARPFVNRLRHIEKESLAVERQPTYRRLNYIRGRPKIADSLISLARRQDYPIHTYLRESSFHNLENRLLSTAAEILLRTTNVDDIQKRILTRWALLSRRKFVRLHELRQLTIGLKSHKYTGSRSYYVPALIMAKLIISQAGLNLEDANLTSSEPIVTNVADLFEKYVRTVISKSLTAKGFLVEKKETKPPTLFVDGTCELIPDVLISQQGIVKIILDVKYKPRPTVDSSDYYQMNAYLDSYGVDTGLLILPNSYQPGFSLTKRETPKGKKIYELRLPLGDWRQSETILSDTILKLL